MLFWLMFHWKTPFILVNHKVNGLVHVKFVFEHCEHNWLTLSHAHLWPQSQISLIWSDSLIQGLRFLGVKVSLYSLAWALFKFLSWHLIVAVPWLKASLGLGFFSQHLGKYNLITFLCFCQSPAPVVPMYAHVCRKLGQRVAFAPVHWQLDLKPKWT